MAARPRAVAEDARREMLRTLVATSIVNGLEIFDFTAFGLFAALIGDQFFPAKAPLTSLLLAVGTFAVGFLTRPLGALVLGAYADRAGRRAALLLTVWLAAGGTAAIALCPPFAAIGFAAPLVVVGGRLLQGFAAGGEIGAAASFVIEAGPVARRGWMVGWQLGAQGAAALLGATLGTLLSTLLTPPDLAAWGWRIPFAIGLLVAPAGHYVRARLRDAPRPSRDGTTSGAVLAELSRKHARTVTLATLMMGGHTVTTYAVVYYMPSYLARVMHLPARIGFQASTVAGVLMFGLAPVAGWIADRLPRRKPLALGASGAMALLAYPVFVVIGRANTALPVLAGIAVLIAPMVFAALIESLLVLEALPAQVRASGFALRYAFGVALFGGTAQVIATALIRWTHDPLAPGWYVMLACAMSFVALLFFDERRGAA